MTAAGFAQQLAAAQQLQRLRELRERKALQVYQRTEMDARDALAKVREREAQIRALQAQRLALQQRLIGEYAARLGAVAAYAGAAQEVLDDQLERAEYALIDEEEELFNARKRSDAARHAWLRAMAQHQACTTLRDDARKGQQRELEARLDREDPPVRPEM